MIKVRKEAGDVCVIYETDTVEEMLALLRHGWEVVKGDGDWLGWNGSSAYSPIPNDGRTVRVKFRNGAESECMYPEGLRWEYSGVEETDGDIVAYKVVK